MNYLQRHMIFHNKDLDYNKISFKLKVGIINSEKEEIKKMFKDNKKENLEIITDSPEVKIIYTQEINFPNIKNKENEFLDRELNEKIHNKYTEMKKEYSEILNILGLYLIEINSVEYKEDYYVKK